MIQVAPQRSVFAKGVDLSSAANSIAQGFAQKQAREERIDAENSKFLMDMSNVPTPENIYNGLQVKALDEKKQFVDGILKKITDNSTKKGVPISDVEKLKIIQEANNLKGKFASYNKISEWYGKALQETDGVDPTFKKEQIAKLEAGDIDGLMQNMNPETGNPFLKYKVDLNKVVSKIDGDKETKDEVDKVGNDNYRNIVRTERTFDNTLNGLASTVDQKVTSTIRDNFNQSEIAALENKISESDPEGIYHLDQLYGSEQTTIPKRDENGKVIGNYTYGEYKDLYNKYNANANGKLPEETFYNALKYHDPGRNVVNRELLPRAEKQNAKPIVASSKPIVYKMGSGDNVSKFNIYPLQLKSPKPYQVKTGTRALRINDDGSVTSDVIPEGNYYLKGINDSQIQIEKKSGKDISDGYVKIGDKEQNVEDLISAGAVFYENGELIPEQNKSSIIYRLQNFPKYKFTINDSDGNAITIKPVMSSGVQQYIINKKQDDGTEYSTEGITGGGKQNLRKLGAKNVKTVSKGSKKDSVVKASDPDFWNKK